MCFQHGNLNKYAWKICTILRFIFLRNPSRKDCLLIEATRQNLPFPTRSQDQQWQFTPFINCEYIRTYNYERVFLIKITRLFSSRLIEFSLIYPPFSSSTIDRGCYLTFFFFFFFNKTISINTRRKKSEIVCLSKRVVIFSSGELGSPRLRNFPRPIEKSPRKQT